MEHNSAKITTKFEPLFNPQSVALIGASSDPKKWGFVTLANLLQGGFSGRIYAVNPRERESLGLTVYGCVGDIPETPDLAVIVVPPSSVVPVLKDCVSKGIRACVVLTSGFAEIGGIGEGLQQELAKVARSGGMLMVGPNCNGIMNPSCELYAQMPSIFPPAGSIAILSQSGNVAFSIARQAMVKGLGCSKYISTGNEANLLWEDYLEYLADDPKTKVILGYVEGFKDGRRFFHIAKEVTKKKPIILLKGGETTAGARAAMSHTASLAGSDAVFGGVCKQAGVIRARDWHQLIDISVALLHQPLPQGRRVAIVTAGGGWGVLAADACARIGLEVVSLPSETIIDLDSLLPNWWNRGNPVDLVGGTRGDTVIKCVEVLLRCPVVDCVILLGIMHVLPVRQFRPSASEMDRKHWKKQMVLVMDDIFDQLSKLIERYQKPILVASDLSSADASFEVDVTNLVINKKCACYTVPHQAASVADKLAQYGEYLRSLS